MASEDIQKAWAGNSGDAACRHPDLRQAVRQRKVLDFGCGFGRMLRPMYFFNDPEHVYGVDPWDRSIDICRQDGLLGQLAVA
jgi:2-polyprenyl-3-methyl-5-hydroxy-6-metoxy-1,4-benzoquinol methylase